MLCPGRHTLSGLITVFGKQYQDWTSDYALYAKDRVEVCAIFAQMRREAEVLAGADQVLCVALDDTILRKRGKSIPGTAYRRDPLGPRFQTNLVWAQREQTLSVAIADQNRDVRMVPIGVQDASTPRKPRQDSDPAQLEAYREQMKQRNLNTLAVETLRQLQRERAQENDGRVQDLRVLVDGSYTNQHVLRNLPANTVLIGRIRKDAKLSAKPDAHSGPGRKRIYGEDLPTPEQIRQDPQIPWIPVRARVNGQWKQFEVKTLAPVRWRVAGEMDLRLVIIRPVGFRLRKGARLSYTQPAYLVCTDPHLPIEEIIQEYVWRWDIEVNHRDAKTILGVGQAQVRNPNSVRNLPATAMAAYAMLLIAAIKAYGMGGKPAHIPEAKWRRPNMKIRPSTQDLLNELRRGLWVKAIRPDHLSDFMNAASQRTKPKKTGPNLCSTLFAATA